MGASLGDEPCWSLIKLRRQVPRRNRMSSSICASSYSAKAPTDLHRKERQGQGTIPITLA